MTTYETVFITTPNLTEDDEKAAVESLKQIILDRGGELHISERMGRRRLAYAIRKYEDGVYIRFLYDSGSDVPTELDRRMKISDRILRSLTVRLEREWAVDAKAEAIDIKARIAAAAEEAARAAKEAEEAAKIAAAKQAEADAASEEAGEMANVAEPAQTESVVPTVEESATGDLETEAPETGAPEIKE